MFIPFGFYKAPESGFDIPTSGLFAWWDFNNPSSYTPGGSTVTDLSGNGNTGAVGSSITTALDGSVRYIQASGGGASTDAVKFGSDVRTDLATATLCIVVKPTTNTNQVWLHPPTRNNSYIAQNATGNFYYQNIGSSKVAYSNTSVDETVIVTADGWKLRTWTGLNLNSSEWFKGFELGGYPSGFGMQAQVVALLMYDRTLSASEILQIYTAYDSVIDLDTAYDTDAQAFFTAVEGGGDTLTTTEKDAVNQLVLDLKADSIWNDILYAYPLVGGTATAHKWNLKDPQDTDAAYRVTWGSVMAHNSLGILGTSNDPDSYGDTHYNPTAASATGHTIAMYVNQGLVATPANEYDYGAFQSPNDNMISFGFNNKTAKFVCFDATSYKTSTGGTYTNSVFAGSNDGTNSSIYQNGTSLVTSAQNFDPVNINYYLLASNRTGTGITSETGRGIGMAIAYDIGLNGTQHSDLSDAITTCVTSLSRN